MPTFCTPACHLAVVPSPRLLNSFWKHGKPNASSAAVRYSCQILKKYKGTPRPLDPQYEAPHISRVTRARTALLLKPRPVESKHKTAKKGRQHQPSEAHHPWSKACLVGNLFERLLGDSAVLVDTLGPAGFLNSRQTTEKIYGCNDLEHDRGWTRVLALTRGRPGKLRAKNVTFTKLILAHDGSLNTRRIERRFPYTPCRDNKCLLSEVPRGYAQAGWLGVLENEGSAELQTRACPSKHYCARNDDRFITLAHKYARDVCHDAGEAQGQLSYYAVRTKPVIKD